MNLSTFYADFSSGVRLRFDSKPSEPIRKALKASGFRWSPVNGFWWRSRVDGAADFVNWLSKQIDREAGIIRPDGACWSCQSPQGFFRNRGAAAPVLCNACDAKERATSQHGQEGGAQ